MGAIEIIALVAILVLTVFVVVILLDNGFFKRKIERIEIGLTGGEIQNKYNVKLKNIEVNEDGYVARVYSVTRLFKYQLVFENGKLARKMPYYVKK